LGGEEGKLDALLQKIFCEAFWNCFRRRAALKTVSINASINRDRHFLLTETVTRNRLAKSINGGGYYKKSLPREIALLTEAGLIRSLPRLKRPSPL
jgi:hypothetical protein